MYTTAFHLIRSFFRRLLSKPLTRLADKFSSAPDKEKVFASLSDLLQAMRKGQKDRGPCLTFNPANDRFIIFSDEHKGIRDDADDFRKADPNYRSALDYYFTQGYTFINLGDCEELWENAPGPVMKSNRDCLASEKSFLDAGRYVRIYGNHDLEWKYQIQQKAWLVPVFGKELKVYEGLALDTVYNGNVYTIFMAHGHQGDQRSDGNAFSSWFVAAIWTPIQRFLDINVNTPATSFTLTDRHNIMMSEWSATQSHLIFISGHTHKPVFASLDHVDVLHRELQMAEKENNAVKMAALNEELSKRLKEYQGKEQIKTDAKPSYFNSGCCCFDDGDITGIEIAEGEIRLIKWETQNGKPARLVLEYAPLSYIFDKL